MSLGSKILARALVIHKTDFFFSPYIESWTESPHTIAARIGLVSKPQTTVHKK